jgi:hypothetical protein
MSEFYNDGLSNQERNNNVRADVESDSDSSLTAEIYYRDIIRALTSETKDMSKSLRIIADNTQLNRCLMVIYMMISIFLGYFYCAYNTKYYEFDEIKNNVKLLDVRINGLRSDFQNQTSNYKEWTVTVLLVGLAIFMIRKH